MKYSLLFFIAHIASAAVANDTTFLNAPYQGVVRIHDEKARGDENQLLGIEGELIKQLQARGYNIEKFNAVKTDPQKDIEKQGADLHLYLNECVQWLNEEAFEATALSSTPPPSPRLLILANGTTAAAYFMSSLFSPHPQMDVVISTHQWQPWFTPALLKNINFLAIPFYANLPEDTISLGRAKYITTNGVSHVITPELLQEEHAKLAPDLVLQPEDCMVIVGGDAPNGDGQVLSFSIEQARRVARAIVAQLTQESARESAQELTQELNKKPTQESKGALHLIDSPRTHPHVLRAFEEEIQQAGRVRYTYHHNGPVNMYKPLLYAAYLAPCKVYVSGDSSSMSTEVASVMASNNVIIYQTDSMNTTHTHHIAALLQGRQAQFICNAADGTMPMCAITPHPGALSDAPAFQQPHQQIVNYLLSYHRDQGY